MNPDQDIRTMLRARAEGVTATPVIPQDTVRRVRVSKALMTGSVAVAIAALMFGGFAASRSLSNEAAPIAPAEESEKREPTVVDVTDSEWVEVLMNMKKTTFVSPINGYSFKYFDRRGGFEPATELWDPANDPSPVEGRVDEFDVVETGHGAFFMSASTKIPEGVSVDEWIDEAVGKYLSPGCYGPRSEQEPITIDGEPGRISHECFADVTATAVKDGRLYLFMMAHSAPTRPEARHVFEAWIDTIELTPETAEVP